MAREIARIVGAAKREEGYFEGGGYAVTWAFGHLVQLAMPDGYGIRGFVRDNLPVIPKPSHSFPSGKDGERLQTRQRRGVADKNHRPSFQESEQIIGQPMQDAIIQSKRLSKVEFYSYLIMR